MPAAAARRRASGSATPPRDEAARRFDAQGVQQFGDGGEGGERAVAGPAIHEPCVGFADPLKCGGRGSGHQLGRGRQPERRPGAPVARSRHPTARSDPTPRRADPPLPRSRHGVRRRPDRRRAVLRVGRAVGAPGCRGEVSRRSASSASVPRSSRSRADCTEPRSSSDSARSKKSRMPCCRTPRAVTRRARVSSSSARRRAARARTDPLVAAISSDRAASHRGRNDERDHEHERDGQPDRRAAP